MAKKREQEAIRLEETLEQLLFALVRAHYDPLRPHIRERGIEERDLAFEADLLSPADTELTIYATQKRRRILSLLRQMEERTWARLEVVAPSGAYHVFLLPTGAKHATSVHRTWWERLLDRWKSRNQRAK